MELNVAIGKKIIFLRLKNKMTQENLAELLCVSRASIANYESGFQSVDIKTLLRLSKIFNVSAEYFLTGTFEEVSQEPVFRLSYKLHTRIDRLPEYYIKLMLKLYKLIKNE